MQVRGKRGHTCAFRTFSPGWYEIIQNRKNPKRLQATQQLTDGKFTSRAGIYWERAECSMIPMTGMKCNELMVLTRLDQLISRGFCT